MTGTERLLILETSGRVGHVALAEGEQMRGNRRLDESRRHARDLAPAVADLLAAAGWKPRDLQAVIVSRGPGSYTGLRVGIMSAKTLAYVTGCAVLALDTFDVIAAQAPAEAPAVDVLADAQQDRVYVQRFSADRSPAEPLTILAMNDWLAGRRADVWGTGPGLRLLRDRPAGGPLVDATLWDPLPETLLRLGLARYRAGQRDDLWALEPLYVRPSSAEEKKMPSKG